MYIGGHLFVALWESSEVALANIQHPFRIEAIFLLYILFYLILCYIVLYFSIYLTCQAVYTVKEIILTRVSRKQTANAMRLHSSIFCPAFDSWQTQLSLNTEVEWNSICSSVRCPLCLLDLTLNRRYAQFCFKALLAIKIIISLQGNPNPN